MPEIRRSIVNNEDAIEEIISRAVVEVYPKPELLAGELRSGRVLTAYLGIDPTAPDLHVGHESQLLKLQRLQQLGHNVIMLIGDFTGMIGDPSDKSAARIKLTKEEVLENAEGYKQQASKIIDFEHSVNPARLMYNSEWLGKMNFADVVELASEVTVQQMLERDMFKRRIGANTPVRLHEFLYPVMQGWDSVNMGVDIEVGGSDQIFNMLVGTDLVKRHLKKQKYVIAGQLLVDPSGKKIGKTEGNMITLNDNPLDMFHKIMLWGDEITPHALELCTNVPMERIKEIEESLRAGTLSGIDGKKFLAKTVICDLHGIDAADKAEQEYEIVSSKGRLAEIEGMAQTNVSDGQSVIDVLVSSGLAPSKSAARRLIEGGAVRLNDEKIESIEALFKSTDEDIVLQVGKRKVENFRRVVFVDLQKEE
jgi:tyrosyl-tRNA synthetase